MQNADPHHLRRLCVGGELRAEKHASKGGGDPCA